MIEWFLSIWLLAVSWPVVGLLILVSVLLEYRESHKMAAFLTIVTGIILWQLTDIDKSYITYGALAYIPIGLAWSIWRWQVHCKRETDKMIARLEEKEHRKKRDEWSRSVGSTSINELRDYKLNPKRHIDRLVAWVLCWPISMIERTIGDVVHMIHVMVTDWFGSVFARISNKSVGRYEQALSKYEPQRKEEPDEDW